MSQIPFPSPVGSAPRVAAIPSAPSPASKPRGGGEFARILEEKSRSLATLHFSGHAQRRMVDRGISLSEGEIASLEGAVQRAERKGSRDSLVLLRDVAFLVNVPHRTVVTAVDRGAWQERVFTQIDSVVIA